MSEVEKLIDLLAEYRMNIRDIAIKAQKENWEEEKCKLEIEQETQKIDQILHAYKVRKEFLGK